MKIFLRMLPCLLALLLSAGSALAQSGPPNHNPDPQAEQNQASITSNVASSAAAASVGALTSHITSLTGPGAGQQGRASGNGPAGLGLWVLGGVNFLDSTKSGGRYDGSLDNVMVGADKQLGDLLLGLATGYERLDLTTKYNTGKILYDGWSLMPYLSYSISRDLVADAMFSYTWLGYTMKDTQAGTRYSDDMDGTRLVTAAGITRYLTWDKLLLSGRLGTLYLHEHQESYRLNAANYGSAGVYAWQGSLGLRGAYDLGQFRPFAGATFTQDIVKSGGRHNDMWGADFELGLNWMATNSLSFGLSGVYGLRESLTRVGGTLNLRYDF